MLHSRHRDGFLMLLIPIMKTISMHSLCVLVRQHDQNLDDEPIVFNFNGPDDDLLGDSGDSKDYLDSGNSDPFTGNRVLLLSYTSLRFKYFTYVSGMESSVFDLRIKRDMTSSAKITSTTTNVLSGEGSLSNTTGSVETNKDYDFAFDFDAPCKTFTV